MAFVKKIAVLITVLTAALLLCSCSGNLFTMHVLALGEGGAQILDDPLKKIPYGGDVSFAVSVPDGESVVQVFADDVLTDACTYENGILTLTDVTAPVTLRVVAGQPDETVYWEADVISSSGGTVTSNVKQGPVNVGSMVTLTALPREGAEFLGWTARFPLRSGGELISEDEQVTVEVNEFTFVIANFDASGVEQPETQATVRPVRKTENTLTIFYHINGGDLLKDNKVAVETTFDTSYWDMPVGREDDGTLTREGYVLLGYSWTPEGEGELIRPGYKFSLPTDEKILTLYCIWQKETDASLFTISEISETAVQIDRYTGSDSVVYIPRKIGGRHVTRIGSGAFAGNAGLTEVHLTPSVQAVAADAFADCPALTTVTIYDNMREVSDDSFAGSPVSTVRLCASTSPRYIDSYIAFGRKFERLVTTAGTKRIVVVSGSSKYWGLDSDYMETLLDGSYSVVNYGTSVGMSILFFLEAASSYLTENDVLVYCPELFGPNAHHTNGNPELPSATFQGIANSYNLLERVDLSKYTNVFNAFAEFTASRLQMNTVSWDSYSTAIDRYGDYVNFRTELNSPDFRFGSTGDFRFDETAIPAEYIPNLNRVLDCAAGTGAKVFFSFPPFNRNAVLPEHLDEQIYDSYMAYITENVHAELISDLRNFIHEGQYFDDTDYHLGAEGRKFHTDRLTADLMAAGVGVTAADTEN